MMERSHRQDEMRPMQQQARAPQTRDHYSVLTCRQLAPVTTAFHSTGYVDSLMRAENLPSTGAATTRPICRRSTPTRFH